MKSIFSQVLFMLMAFLIGLRLAWVSEDSVGRPELKFFTEVPQLVVPEKTPEPAFPVEAELERKLAALVDTRSRVPEDFAGPFEGDQLLKLAKAVRRLGENQDYIRYAVAWARHNPQQMWDYFLKRGSCSIPVGEQPTNGRQETTLSDVLFPAWLKQDPRACLDAVMAAPLGVVDEEGLIHCAHTLWESHPEEVFALLAKSFEKKLSPHRSWFGAYQLTEEAARARLDQINQLPPGDVRTRLMEALLYAARNSNAELSHTVWTSFSLSEKAAILEGGYLSTHDQPEIDEVLAALRLQVEAQSAPADVDNFLNRYGHYWAKKDLSGAVAWAAAHSSGQTGIRHVADLLRGGFDTQPQAAAEVLSQLPDGSWRDHVLAEVTSRFGVGGSSEAQSNFYKALSAEDRERLREKGFKAP